MVEAAWTYRMKARISRARLGRMEGLAKPVRDIAWKAEVRLCARYRRLSAAGKPANVVTAAIAREMLGFAWPSPSTSNRARPPEHTREKPAKKEERQANRHPAGAHAWRRGRGQGNPRGLYEQNFVPTLELRPRQPRDEPRVMRFQPAHQRMINRRYDGLASCHARRPHSTNGTATTVDGNCCPDS